MAHNLLRNRMAFVDEEPWHGLGKQVPPTVSAKEMCSAAGLDWAVEKVPAPGARVVKPERELYDRYLIVRDAIPPDKEPVALGMVGSGYEPLQNTDAFTFFEPLINNRFAQFHTAGALGNGERVWVLAKLAEQIIVAGNDVIDRFLLLSNTHDGSGAVTVRFTPIRVVCQNTLNFALKRSTGLISVRHSRHIARNLAEAQAEQLRRIVEEAFKEAGTLFRAMALKSITDENVDVFLEFLFPRTKNQKFNNEKPERWKRIKAILEDRSVTPPKTKGTLWVLYNAIIRDEDYRKTREASPDDRLDRVWFGSGRDIKLKALTACRQHMQKAA